MTTDQIIEKLIRGKHPGILPEQLPDVIKAGEGHGMKIQVIRHANGKEIVTGLKTVFGMGDEQKDIEMSEILRRTNERCQPMSVQFTRPETIHVSRNPGVTVKDLADMLVAVGEAYADGKGTEVAVAVVERLKIYFAQKDCYYKLPKEDFPLVGVRMIPTLDRVIELIKQN